MGIFANFLPSPRRGWHIPVSEEGGLCTVKKPLAAHFSNFSRPLETEALFKREKEDLKEKRERERQKKRNGELNRRKGRKKGVRREEKRAIPGEVGSAENERQEPREGEQRQRGGERKTQA